VNDAKAPAGWLEILAESEADVAAGKTVPAHVVRQGLRDSIARLEAKAAARQRNADTSRR
jgi:hypothetical protein